METILDIITRTEKGVDTGNLKKETGFESKKISNVIHSLKAQGKVKSAEKEVYLRARGSIPAILIEPVIIMTKLGGKSINC